MISQYIKFSKQETIFRNSRTDFYGTFTISSKRLDCLDSRAYEAWVAPTTHTGCFIPEFQRYRDLHGENRVYSESTLLFKVNFTFMLIVAVKWRDMLLTYINSTFWCTCVIQICWCTCFLCLRQVPARAKHKGCLK